MRLSNFTFDEQARIFQEVLAYQRSNNLNISPQELSDIMARFGGYQTPTGHWRWESDAWSDTIPHPTNLLHYVKLH